MELLGYEITVRRKAAVSPIRSTDGGWRSFTAEPFAGAWQRNIERKPKNILAHSAVYGCVSLIASDIGKLRLKLVERDSDGIWTETESAAFSPVLRKPNRYQTRQKFIENWIVSKLVNGNAYILKERDNRGVVVALYVLEPSKVRAYVSPDGSIFYSIGNDNLTGIEGTNITVPESEIIHDVMVALYHPLCGVSPLTACALPACHGLNIQEFSEAFFANNAQPGGILTAPGAISQEQADNLKKNFSDRFSGANIGKLYVVGDGLEYKPMPINAVDAQLIEQLKWTAEQVCTCFHVPAYMIGVGPPPTYTNIEALSAQYYAQCLQSLIEAIEALLDEGLGLSTKSETMRLGTEFDLGDLMRMDTPTRVKAIADQVNAGLLSPNEGRAEFSRKPVKGGEQPLLQQQMWQLGQLAERPPPDDVPDPPPTPVEDDDSTDDGGADDGEARGFGNCVIFARELGSESYAYAALANVAGR